MTTIPTHPQLTEREHLFVEAIVSGATRTEAARRSGYGGTAQSQRVQGSRLMRRPKIKHAIDEARKARDQQGTGESIMQSDEVLERFSDLARHGETERIRLDALGQLGRRYSLWSDTVRLQQDQRAQDEHERVGDAIAGRIQGLMELRERERHEQRDGKAR